ncbi:MAG TPA: hypothetical protein PLP07_15185 [Pyrinomonadaceae bacterium]|nr:hypothetical protein [Chloracidobacterium sp.]MBP9934755.1 hypothetical protein [Pyrinomonadaceae bacterium]MBK7803215.1 hypothetical protein [Chloracidobacterium sp.]MBK9438141.1 hypothetical protein [Chloracidobacterium sp.]MBL0240985.1 hypothetical protein [Chloracidobacterium sp.]
MTETHDFFNEGYGWQCRVCSREMELARADTSTLPLYYRQGEAESRGPLPTTQALARWTDATRRSLTCPRCGITELIDIN